MAAILQPLKELTELEQVVHYHVRSRTRGFRDIEKGLYRTHQFDLTQASVLTGTIFPNRVRPITFATAIEITGASAAGLIFEFGSSTTGIKLAVSGGQLLFAAGDSAVGNGGIDGAVTLAALGTIGARLQIGIAISPGHGQARLWVGGVLVARIQNDPPVQLTSVGNEWSGSEAGSIGSIENGSSNTRIAITAAPTDFKLIEQLSAYIGQLPKHFHHGFAQVLSRPPDHGQLPSQIQVTQDTLTAIPLIVTDIDGDLISVTVTVTNGLLAS